MILHKYLNQASRAYRLHLIGPRVHVGPDWINSLLIPHCIHKIWTNESEGA